MSTRSSTLPLRWDLSPEFRDILQRNGMQARITIEGDNIKMMVKGHDSPFISYDITPEQMRALTDWGTNSANKKAYNTFVDIVGNDFYLPRSYVHAQHANCRVAMGLHGYRLSHSEARSYGITPSRAYIPLFGRGLLGWTPRNQPGYHLARPDGALFIGSNGPMVADRAKGYMKPGELQSGAYGFYYKGQPSQPVKQEFDVLAELESVVQPQELPVVKKEDAKPYKELITSPVYFSNEKFQECLSSHGIVISQEDKTMIIQSEGSEHNLSYQLTDEEIGILTDNSLKNVSLENRLELLNNIIKEDFSQPVTMEMLNSKEVISISLHPEVAQELLAQQSRNVSFSEQYDNYLKGTFLDPTSMSEQYNERPAQAHPSVAQPVEQMKATGTYTEIYKSHRSDDVAKALVIDGKGLQDLDISKGWYRDGKNSRAAEVSVVAVETLKDGGYRMTAVIDGEKVSHEISEKQFNKFSALDDYHRFKMFDKVFDEVKIKSRPEEEIEADRAQQGRKTFERFMETYTARDVAESIAMNGASLQALNENKAWYREIENGREVRVDDIMAHKMKDGKCCLTAVIDGKHITHEISQKQFDKFAALDDYHRFKMVSKVFDEVDMKTRPGKGFNLLAALTAGIAVAGEVAGAVHHARHRPEFYESHYHGPAPRILYKPFVDTPESIAARAFDLGRNSADNDFHRGR